MPKIGVSLIVLIIFLAGCNKNEQNGDETKMQSLVGYVVLKDNNRAILITTTETPVKEDYDLSEGQLMNKFKNNIVIVGLSEIEIDNTDDLKRGEKIKVWFHTLKESNPPSATIQKYELL
ncbi:MULTISPECIES: DUF3221 domain-containing protein [Bacillus]|uniref:DUF3221 domain-containing protein n=1 Tax=Bacillus TaxID=1386 RepID=UPI0002A14BDC|nr:DUF3221 domain-containing protein [Bacillus subtilis]AGA23370.1 Hypothetical protein YobA [Bacillus subtilis subsp. subtilis str. BSP1]AMR47025.1 hypothetical protein KHRBS_11525 [Bacillus subtilis subsp. subtilis]KMN96534.1 hypothetical protein VL08_08160 [Bacillus subtilis]MBG8575435.1 hypothetical protein [Bacillus subtilis]MBG9626291.1 hypothetical protein [Bacillus subtilis]